jgi:hypothetical protein
VIAADELEHWVATTPAVALWLARQIGKVISNEIRDLEQIWDEWSLVTKPAITPQIVASGRGKDIETVHRWISEPPNLLEVQGDSPDEAIAFLYAAIQALPDKDRTKALSRSVFVNDATHLRSCVHNFQTPLVFAAPSDCVDPAGVAVAKGHHVFLSADAKTVDVGGRLVALSRSRRAIFEESLRANGFSRIQAQRHARDSGCSLPVLRRRLSRVIVDSE